MTGDRQDFEAATEKWLSLGGGKDFQRPTVEPAVAILFPQYGNIEHYYREARDLRRFYRAVGSARILVDSQLDGIALEETLADKSITDVIVIGRGDISEVETDIGESLDWLAVAMMTKHLKGSFTYRNHNNFPVSPSIPLGLFATGNHNNVLVPRNRAIPDEDHDDAIVVPYYPAHHMKFSDTGHRD